MTAKPVTVTAQLTSAQAWALAELIKRIGWTDVRSLAVDDQEAGAMIEAIDLLRGSLDSVGYRPR